MAADRAVPTVTAETPLPELFRVDPRTRRVFDRYGLRGCGGTDGPAESVGFFARTHGVPLERLLSEVRGVLDGTEVPADAPRGRDEALADTIYRRFFIAGIAVALTAGAGWGVALLWRIGLAGRFTEVSVHEVNAHGHAQVLGWVGLFILGFAYQAFPRMWHVDLAAPRWAARVFGMLLAGIVLRVAATAAAGSSALVLPVALAGGALELAALGIFAGQVVVTWRRAGRSLEPWTAFVFLGLVWLIAQGVWGLGHAAATLGAPSADELVRRVATWQPPLRDLQVHGVALFFILGVSLRMVPALFDVPSTPARAARWGLALCTAGLLAEVGLWLGGRLAGWPELSGALPVAWGLLAAGVAAVVVPWRLHRRPGGPGANDRSLPFVRAAYVWLAVSLVMLLLTPLHRVATGLEFSHAWNGAVRHAVTVGCVSMMILGMGAKVVPTLNGIAPARLGRLTGPFLLVNAGCLLRVALQAATDWRPGAFAAIGVSGTLELAGIAWWSLGLLAVIREGRRAERADGEAAASPAASPPPARIRPEHRPADVLAWFPGSERVFAAHGLGAVRNPVLRRTVGRRLSLREGCAIRGVDVDRLVADLNAVCVGGFVPSAELAKTGPGADRGGDGTPSSRPRAGGGRRPQAC